MIGGNITADLQLNVGGAKNEIGELIPSFTTVNTLTGFLDYQSGETKYQSYNAKIAESTHIFMCDCTTLDDRIMLNGENCRMIIDGERYDINLIDDVMRLHKHYEIFLQYTGGQ